MAPTLNLLAQAQAQRILGDERQTGLELSRLSDLLRENARTARSKVTGLAGGPRGKAPENMGLGGEGAERQNGPQESNGGSSLPPIPPFLRGILDEDAWKRIPESLRRELQQTAPHTPPDGYEASIRRYFQNLAGD
jgi:hypothetical protein